MIIISEFTEQDAANLCALGTHFILRTKDTQDKITAYHLSGVENTSDETLEENSTLLADFVSSLEEKNVTQVILEVFDNRQRLENNTAKLIQCLHKFFSGFFSVDDIRVLRDFGFDNAGHLLAQIESFGSNGKLGLLEDVLILENSAPICVVIL